MRDVQVSGCNKSTEDLRRKILRRNFLRKQIDNVQPTLIERSSEDMEVDVENNSDCEDNNQAEIPTQTVETNSDNEDNQVEMASTSKSDVKREAKSYRNSSWKSTLNIDFSQFSTTRLSSRLLSTQKTTVLTTKENVNVRKSIENSGSTNEEMSRSNLLSKSGVEIPDEIYVQLKHKLSKSSQRNRGIFKAKHKIKNNTVTNDKTPKSYLKRVKRKVKNCFSKVQTALGKSVDKESGSASINKAFESPKIAVIKPVIDFASSKITQSSNCVADNPFTRKESFNDNISQTCGSNLASTSKLKSPASVGHVADLRYPVDEIKRLQIKNRLLQEENQVLSASLSSIMENVDLVYNYYTRSRVSDYSSKENVCTTSVNQSQHEIYMENDHNYSQSPVHTKAKVLRSRSLQEQTERKHVIKQHLSSHSMSHRSYARYPQRSLYRAKPCIITPSCSSPREYPLIKPKKSHVYSAGIIKDINTLSRRSSMPERKSKRPLVARRSSCVQDSPLSRSRQSLLSLPTDAFY